MIACLHRFLFVFLFGFVFINLTIGQDNFPLTVVQADADENGSFRKITDLKTEFATQQKRTDAVSGLLKELRSEGYLTSSTDSLVSKGNALTLHLNLGKQFRWGRLKPGNVDEDILSKSGFREKLYTNRKLTARSVSRLFEQVIVQCEEHGYPFAAISMKDIQWVEDGLEATLHLEKNRQIKIDSIRIIGDAKIGLVYLTNYLGIKLGSDYKESALRRISTRINELPFLTESQPHEIVITDAYTKLNLYLDTKKANGFDGILGLLQDDETGEITFTGDVRLKLANALNRGEELEANWRRLPSKTQDLKMSVLYPFIFNTPFGLDMNFKLYRRDTIFSDIYYDLGSQYQLSGGNFFKLFFSQQSSNLLATSQYEESTVLPPILDLTNSSYGIGLRSEKLDYRLNPRKGFRVIGTARTGTRIIRKNSQLNPVIYDSLDLRTVNYQAELLLEQFIPLFGRSTMKLGLNSAFIYNENLFQNELYRIGGIKTLRGFDEESIFASAFSIFTMELRYLMEQNSYLYLFGDAAYYEDRSSGQDESDIPFGFGVGTSFETGAGIFSINYALGSQQGNPIQLRAAKIHFGFVNFF